MGKKIEANVVKISKKGGPGSGHHGHSGLPGVHGGSRPAGSGDYALPIEVEDEWIPDKVNKLYVVGKDDVLPDLLPPEITEGNAVLIVDDLGRGKVYAGTDDDFPSHANLANAVGIEREDEDKTVRVEVFDGELRFHSYYSVPYSFGHSDEEIDTNAEKNISRAARRMIQAGFDPDTPATWEMAGSTLISLTLKDFKEVTTDA